MTDREGQPSRRREESGQPRDPEWQEWTEEREEERAAAYEKQRERQAGGWTEWTWEEEYRRREARSRRHQTHPGGESGEEPRHPGPRRERSGTWDQRDRAPEPQNSRTREQRGAEGQYSWTEVRSRWTCGSRSERRSPNPGREQPTALGRPPATTPWKAGRDKASKPESRGWGRNPPRGERADPVYERGGLGAHQEYSQRASGGSQGLPYTQKGRWRGPGNPNARRWAEERRGEEDRKTPPRRSASIKGAKDRKSVPPGSGSTKRNMRRTRTDTNTQTQNHTKHTQLFSAVQTSSASSASLATSSYSSSAVVPVPLSAAPFPLVRGPVYMPPALLMPPPMMMAQAIRPQLPPGECKVCVNCVPRAPECL